MKPIRIAMMSLTHGHSRKYYQTLRENKKLQWVAACAEDAQAMNVFRHYEQQVPCYHSAEEMFDKHPEIEAVVIASSNDRHLAQVCDCARRGIHILMMKIPTFDLAEYDQMIDQVRDTGIVCQVELELHYNPVVRRLKELVASGELGRILSIQATNITLTPVWAFPWQGVPEASYGSRIPLRESDKRFRGGALCDHPHAFDLIRHLTGAAFDTVFAEVGPNLRPELDVEDMLLANGRMTDGSVFLIDPSWSRMEERLTVPGPGWEVFPKRMEVNVTVVGEKGTIACDCFGPNVYHNGGPNDRYTVQYTYFDEWIGMIDEFVHCIREQQQPQISLEWHRPTIEIMNACYDSIQARQPVQMIKT